MSRNEKLQVVKDHICSYPDFPKKGILFRDIFSVLADKDAFRALMDLMAEHALAIEKPVSAVVGLEARGFLFGPHLSLILNVPFVPVRKKGKLPGKVASVEYSLEYGSDCFEVQENTLKPGQSVLIVDDLLATGGSMVATCRLMENLNVTVAECFAVMELVALKGREKIKSPVHSLLQF